MSLKHVKPPIVLAQELYGQAPFAHLVALHFLLSQENLTKSSQKTFTRTLLSHFIACKIMAKCRAIIASLTLILICLVALGAACVLPVKAQYQGSISINALGSIEPSTVYTLTDNIYNVTFVESGLPSGTQWEAIFNGTQHFSTTNTIKIDNVSATIYLWSIPNAVALNLYEGNPPGTVYSAVPPSGRMNIEPYFPFLNIEQQITFYPISTSSPSPSPTPTIAEFPSLVILPLLIIMLFVAVILRLKPKLQRPFKE